MHKISTDKFMENILSMRWNMDLNPDDITAMNLLSAMLNGRSEKYPTRQEWSQATSRAYGLKAVWRLFTMCDQVVLEFRVRWLNSAWMDDEEYIPLLLDLIDQAAFHPVFSEKNLEQAKMLHKQRLMQLRQDPDWLALSRALQICQKDHPITIPASGTLEQADGVTLEQVKSLFEKVTKQGNLYLAGDIEPEVEAYCKEHFDAQPSHVSLLGVSEQPVREEKEEKDISQSSLAMIYATGTLSTDEDYFSSFVLCSLLGQSSVSLLFEEVREKHSLCYSISTSSVASCGVMAVSTAAARENIDQARELIEQIIEQVKEGQFEQETLDLVKREILDNLSSQADSASSMIEQAFLNEILDRPLSVEEMKREVAAVTKEDIAKSARKLKLLSVVEILSREEDADETAC